MPLGIKGDVHIPISFAEYHLKHTNYIDFPSKYKVSLIIIVDTVIFELVTN